MFDNLIFWTWAGMAFRILAVIVMVYVIFQQVAEYRARVVSELTWLKWLKIILIGCVVLTILSNVPIILLNISRLCNEGTASNAVTSFASIGNAFSMFLVAVMWYLIYRFK